jgi:hypothetical protein
MTILFVKNPLSFWGWQDNLNIALELNVVVTYTDIPYVPIIYENVPHFCIICLQKPSLVFSGRWNRSVM